MNEHDLISSAIESTQCRLPDLEKIRENCLDADFLRDYEKAEKARVLKTAVPAAASVAVVGTAAACAALLFRPGTGVIPRSGLMIQAQNRSSGISNNAAGSDFIAASTVSGPLASASASVAPAANEQPSTLAPGTPASNADGNPITQAYTNEAAPAPPVDWNTLPVYEQYSSLKFDGTAYTCAMYLQAPLIDIGGVVNGTVGVACGSATKYTDADLGTKLGSMTASASVDGKNHTIGCTVYAVRNISPDCLIAVKFDGSNGYYSYANKNYCPATLGDLINDLDLHKTLVVANQFSYGTDKDGNYVSMLYTVPDTSIVWTTLLNNTGAKNVWSDADADTLRSGLMSVSVSLPVAGEQGLAFSVDDAGYLTTNLLGFGKRFYIGKDNVQAFMNYVLKDGTGKVTAAYSTSGGAGTAPGYTGTGTAQASAAVAIAPAPVK